MTSEVDGNGKRLIGERSVRKKTPGKVMHGQGVR